MRRGLVAGGALALSALLAASAGAGGGVLTPGEILVSDLGNSDILVVDPTTGNRSILSGNGVGSGIALSDPRGLLVEPNGQVLVADSFDQALIQIDPATGDRTVVSGGGVGTGTDFALPLGIAAGPSGSVYIADGGGFAGDNAVFRVDLATGDRTLISSSALGIGSGAAFNNIAGIVVDSSGNLIVTDRGTFLDPSLVFRIDPTTGNRTILSGGNVGTGPDLDNPRGLSFGPGGVLETANSGGFVMSIDSVTGNRTILSDTLGAVWDRYSPIRMEWRPTRMAICWWPTRETLEFRRIRGCI